MSRPIVATCVRGLALLLVGVAWHGASAEEPAAVASGWRGPADAFVKDAKGRITGSWWQGGAVGVAHFTGPGAPNLPAVDKVCHAVAEAHGMPCVEIHRDDVVQSADDPNSALLYPDGTARVCLLMMPGGNAATTARDVAGTKEPKTVQEVPAAKAAYEVARTLPRQAVATGMNYVGVCGGAFLGASGYSIPDVFLTHWCLWPGQVPGGGPGRQQPFPDVVFADSVAADHPLRRASGDGLKQLFFNGGPLDFQKNVPHTEYFGVYRGGAMRELEGKEALLSYLPADKPTHGRIILCSGHPEMNHAEFLQAMQEYAIGHRYAVPRNLVKGTRPLKGVSGDKQLHYYCVPAAAGKRMIVTLSDARGCCSLFVRHDLPPTFDGNDGEATEPGVTEKTVEIAPTQKGDYYIGVYGDHDVVRGVDYTLTVKTKAK
jgi:hypothetical protein